MNELADNFIIILIAFAVAMAVSFVATKPVTLLAHKIGAIDVPKDGRRMHTKPIPRMGGLAIFAGFILSVLLFVEITPQMQSILLGAVILIVLGIVDDVVALNPWIKLAFQVLAAVVPVLNGVVVERMTNFAFWNDALYIDFGVFSIPLTVIWIVGMTNAVNWIDGLDGLCAGVSSIASLSMFVIALRVGDGSAALIMIALTGACFGFLPYNRNPAKIFMGDTGSMFLGYMLATMSVQGMFKLYAVVSFAVPLLVLLLPLFDSLFSIVRRLIHGKSPFYADRGHIHHRLIDMGLNQKQAVAILYVVSGLMGLAAVVLTTDGEMRALLVILTALATAALGIKIYFSMSHHKHPKDPALTEQAPLDPSLAEPPQEEEPPAPKLDETPADKESNTPEK